ncbi:hypothetical protein HN51_070548 [Arachis hypogaea]|uniref:UV-B-induced protein n=2 Tax=Arachis hypogaea TaxID=3818 RepID=A0A444Z1I4_ARAHY|nr:UV-B-induced protein At3g17800, chloroplastic isoform X1 [Arachis ipaensis]XP_025655568.1 UV-B-induced protein At3g17800, chloroplastic isoform X1 [Arachis hypogaea]QHO12976.1 UV-B-induced protein [Arachis hypogaea]RYR08030.1 hypothetical protein Ahy_B05g075569 isoform A [Arachis hypogaea]
MHHAPRFNYNLQMEAPAAAAAAVNIFPSLSGSYKPSIFIRRSNVLPFRSNSGFFNNKLCTSVPISRLGHLRLAEGSRKGFVVRASSSSEQSSGSSSKFAPLQLESPIGQFLSEILVSHPHLVPAAVEQQLEQFQTDCDGDKRKEEPSASGTDIVLYRRIAEVKANERRKALEEILYALVVQKFMDANVSLVPSITPNPSGRVDSWPEEDEKIEKLHSSEVHEMIQNHLSVILGNRTGDLSSLAQISKLRLGQVYAASVMYGYFLKRVDQRFQLEKTMKILPNTAEENNSYPTSLEDTRHKGGENLSSVMSHPEVSSLPSSGISSGGSSYATKASRLRNYVMSFDGETLQRYATIRSKEAVSMVEKHTQALFGRPEMVITPQGAIDSSKDVNIKISFGGLKRLVLEAVTFGSFLWDVESYVDSRYHFVLS